MDSSPNEPAEGVAPPVFRFGYFVLQARAHGVGDQAQVAGVIENLSTGEKQAFGSADEMAQWFGRWAGLPPSAT